MVSSYKRRMTVCFRNSIVMIIQQQANDIVIYGVGNGMDGTFNTLPPQFMQVYTIRSIRIGRNIVEPMVQTRDIGVFRMHIYWRAANMIKRRAPMFPHPLWNVHKLATTNNKSSRLGSCLQKKCRSISHKHLEIYR